MVTRTFRLFVSSTFRDFTEERRLLHEEVFPELERLCATHGFGFRAVDMRWGVSADAQIDQRTADLCLEEVVDARAYPAPNLLILCGDRYGWVPLPYAIAADAYEAAIRWLAIGDNAEIVAVLDRVYQRDENHRIAGALLASAGETMSAYTLRAREGDLADFADPNAWMLIETRLRHALQAAAHHLHRAGLLSDECRDQTVLSLTEQEIRQGLTGVAPSAIAWIRTTHSAEPGARALSDLVGRLVPADQLAFGDFNAADYQATFVSTVTGKLKAAIERHITSVQIRTRAADAALQEERDVHNAFAEERVRVFVGRSSNRAAIEDYLDADVRHPLVLKGISGAGKSALMARAAVDAENRGGVPVVKRFVGASAASTEQRSLLISICTDLEALGVTKAVGPWEEDANRFVSQVRTFIAAIAQPVTIFVDALDQLRAPYRAAWLPDELPKGVKIVVSTLEDEAYASESTIIRGLTHALPDNGVLEIEPLRRTDGGDILADLQRDAQRSLTKEQQDYILDRFVAAGASPLYLKVAFALARRWRSSDDPRARGLADDVAALIGQFLDELSSVRHHAPQLVARALGLVAAGREGVSESELLAVLSRDHEVMAAVSSEQFGASTQRLPDSVWVRLRRDMQALLVEKGSDGERLLQFFHRQVAEVVRIRFYDRDRSRLHHALAEFFEPERDWRADDLTLSRRCIVELPFQLHHAKQQDRLDALLTNPAWIDKSVAAFGGTIEVAADYESFASSDDAKLIGRTLRLIAGNVARDLRQCLPQLHGRLLHLASSTFLSNCLEQMSPGAIYETQAALTPPGAELARFEPGDRASRAVTALAVLPNGVLAVGHSDGSIRGWDPITGAEAVRCNGHESAVRAFAILPDGRLASGSDDKSVRVWDANTGSELLRLEGHRYPVKALAVLADGRLVSGGDEITIRVWDVSSGVEVARLDKGLGGDGVSSLAVLPDGRLASAWAHSGIRIWDMRTGAEMLQLRRSTNSLGPTVSALTVLPNGRLACIAEGKIQVWDVNEGVEVSHVENHKSAAFLVVTPQGQIFAGSQNGDIRTFGAPHTKTFKLEGHREEITVLVALQDGRLASGSRDNSVRIWNPQAAPGAVLPDKNSQAVEALALLPDGRVVSGSGGALGVWDTKSCARVAEYTGRPIPEKFGGHKHFGATQIYALLILDDGTVASGCGDGVRIWDANAGVELSYFDTGASGARLLAALPGGRLVAPNKVISHQDGAYSTRDFLSIWDVATGKEVSQIEAGYVTALAGLPTGCLAIGYFNEVRICDVEAKVEIARFSTSHAGGDSALAVLPDGRVAAASGDGEWVAVWNTQTAEEFVVSRRASAWRSVDRHYAHRLAVMAGGLLAVSAGTTVRILEVLSRTEVGRIELDGEVRALLGLPDGRLVVGDNLGRLHWLAIKPARPRIDIARQLTAPALLSASATLPHTTSNAPPTAKTSAPSTENSLPAEITNLHPKTAAPKGPRKVLLPTTFFALALLVALAAAALWIIWIGPEG
ncbi:AAA family ATPase [Vitreimonas flagellata]|uniref:AAA family ATPase n=1 Tax=Vitreimonas flagellata TaxID=2560861 RepID=UPI00142FBC19|nr:AAA family ATPase [Vitreimonas flagellata]